MKRPDVSLRTELLFRPDSDELSPLGSIILLGRPRYTFPPEPEDRWLRLARLEEQFHELAAVYQTATTARAFYRYWGFRVRPPATLPHALRRCAWVLPRLDALLLASSTASLPAMRLA